MKIIIRLVLVVIVIGLVAAAGSAIWYNNAVYGKTSCTAECKEIDFNVEQGEATISILNRLEQQKLISSSLASQLYLKFNDGISFKAGKFKFKEGSDIPTIMSELSKTPFKNTAWVTLKEGFRYTKLLEDLKPQLQTGNVAMSTDELKKIFDKPHNYLEQFSDSASQFIQTYIPEGKSIEGFIYPDTYNIDTEIKPIEFADLLVNTLKNKITDNDLTKIKSTNFNLYQIITIASILTVEANNETDYKLVAGIINNRLKSNQKLDMDSTLLYGFNKKPQDPLYQSEIDNAENPYNTRRRLGLPPTPINNPGSLAIKSALNPTPSQYFFFITGRDGKNYYAKTYAEHNRNIQLYMN